MPPLRFELRTFALCEDTSATRYPYAIEANEIVDFVFNYIDFSSLVRPRLTWSPRRILRHPNSRATTYHEILYCLSTITTSSSQQIEPWPSISMHGI